MTTFYNLGADWKGLVTAWTWFLCKNSKKWKVTIINYVTFGSPKKALVMDKHTFCVGLIAREQMIY